MATKTSTALVAVICLYGTHATGAGYIGVIAGPDGRSTAHRFGTGEPVAGRSFTEAVWSAQAEIAAFLGYGATGRVRIFHPGGETFAEIGLHETCYYGDLARRPVAEVLAA